MLDIMLAMLYLEININTQTAPAEPGEGGENGKH